MKLLVSFYSFAIVYSMFIVNLGIDYWHDTKSKHLILFYKASILATGIVRRKNILFCWIAQPEEALP